MTKKAGKANITELKFKRSQLKTLVDTYQMALEQLPTVLKVSEGQAEIRNSVFQVPNDGPICLFQFSSVAGIFCVVYLIYRQTNAVEKTTH